jgi:hypothetical protein
MKQLYVRFFSHKTDTLVTTTHLVWNRTCKASINLAVTNCGNQIGEWMEEHPDGKVDFLWV